MRVRLLPASPEQSPPPPRLLSIEPPESVWPGERGERDVISHQTHRWSRPGGTQGPQVARHPNNGSAAGGGQESEGARPSGGEDRVRQGADPRLGEFRRPHADQGNGKGYSGLLKAVGVDTIRELRYRNPANLAKA